MVCPLSWSGAVLAERGCAIARIASAFVTIVLSSPVSSASGLVAVGQVSRGEIARRPAAPFVLPRDDRPLPKPAAERNKAEPAADAEPSPRPAKADAPTRDPARETAASASQDVSDTAADAKAESKPGSASLVVLQEDAPESGAAGIADKADAAASGDLVAAVADAAQPPQADAAANAAQPVQITVPGQIAVVAAADAAGEQLAVDAIALEATAKAVPSGAINDDKAGQQQVAAGNVVSATASVVTAGEAQKSAAADAGQAGDDKAAVTNAPGSHAGTTATKANTTAAAQGDATGHPASGEAQSQHMPAEAKTAGDTKTDLASAAAGAAKNELMARLEQSFAAPHARPPEIAPAPLPPQAAAPELPKAIPPSAVPMEIGLRSLQGMKEFQIRLDPAELGRIDVKLEIGDDKSVTARVVVDRVETLHLLQREAKTLERAFEQAGLKSSDAGVEITLRDPGQQSQQGRREDRSDDVESGRPPSGSGKPALAEMPVMSIRRTLHVGALDRSI
jgi:flagellar hook-length control protein FliK